MFKVERNDGQGGSIVGYVQHMKGPYKIHKSLNKMINLEKKFKLNNLQTFKKFDKQLKKSKNKILNLIKKN